MFIGADVVVLVSVVILVCLFSVQHYGTDKVGWLFAPVVLLWFLMIGGIGIFNIYKYDSSVLRAFSPVYIYRYLRSGRGEGWTSLGGIMLSITGFHLSSLSLSGLMKTHLHAYIYIQLMFFQAFQPTHTVYCILDSEVCIKFQHYSLLQGRKHSLLILPIFHFLLYRLLLRQLCFLVSF